uniref:pentapeptide repeat-containing protein n=1 Tax=Methanococcoides methylutens TaxID=2226 RepID=UPI002453699C|nr:pentapeptide repeat-containing protein [Methanococcoides methylutens]
MFDDTLIEDCNYDPSNIYDVTFKNAQLEDVTFEKSLLINCNFDLSVLKKINFRRCELIESRFRKAKVSWGDFKYCDINLATFQDSNIKYCDFYRALFKNVVVFRHCKIRNSSLYCTYFSEGATIRKDNLKDGKILQQDEDTYRDFLEYSKERGIKNRDWNLEKSLNDRFLDAEDIFRSLSGFWLTKGYMHDSNWAYVQAKRIERKRLKNELEIKKKKSSYYVKFKMHNEIFWNYIADISCKYGESLTRITRTLFATLLIFALIYYIELSLTSINQALWISFQRMVTINPEELTNVPNLIQLISLIQTIISILLIGLLGFILGNKVRHQ